MTALSLKFCKARCLWNIIKDSPLTGIICAHVRCWKIRKSCRNWYIEQEQSAQIWNHRKVWNTFVGNVLITQKIGAQRRSKSGNIQNIVMALIKTMRLKNGQTGEEVKE